MASRFALLLLLPLICVTLFGTAVIEASNDVNEASSGDVDSAADGPEHYDGDDVSNEKGGMDGSEMPGDVGLKPHDEVKISYLFPNATSDGLKVMLGDYVRVLLLVNNLGSRSVNISHVDCSLHSPFKHDLYIQNFTTKSIGTPALKETGVSVEYLFRPDPALHPIEYQLSGRVYYAVDGLNHMTTFYNSTIEMLEAPFDWSLRSLLSYVLGISGFAMAGYAVKAMFSDSPAAENRLDSSTKRPHASTPDWVDPSLLARPQSNSRTSTSRRKNTKKR